MPNYVFFISFSFSANLSTFSSPPAASLFALASSFFFNAASALRAFYFSITLDELLAVFFSLSSFVSLFFFTKAIGSSFSLLSGYPPDLTTSYAAGRAYLTITFFSLIFSGYKS
jgi:hypothetical protein